LWCSVGGFPDGKATLTLDFRLPILDFGAEGDRVLWGKGETLVGVGLGDLIMWGKGRSFVFIGTASTSSDINAIP
jgi:hypothetical protein